MYERLYAWEGKPEQIFDFGEVVVHTQPGLATALCFRFSPVQVETRLDEIIKRVEPHVQRCLWIIGPNTQPSDLEERFIARNFTRTAELQGLALDNFSLWNTNNSAVSVEPLSWENVEDYATLCSPPTNEAIRAEQLTYAHRYLQFSHKEIQIFVARLEGHLVGYALLRMEPSGTANLCEAFTLTAARGRGVYLSLVAHRLAVAKEQGSMLAVTRANIQTSAPTLEKRGFKRVCCFFVLAHEP
jgi:hypothetical protein